MKEIISEIKECGLHFVAKVDLKKIVFSSELLDMCKMNSCGNYNTNWGCPSGAEDIEKIKEKIVSFKDGIVYQRIENLEDSFDYEGMGRGAEEFSKITLNIKELLEKKFDNFIVLGAGGCKYCEKCTYPHAECNFPNKKNTSVEACGIYVSNLCENAGLNYINGVNTVTNTGLIAINL